jgi:hypothetical protein
LQWRSSSPLARCSTEEHSPPHRHLGACIVLHEAGPFVYSM